MWHIRDYRHCAAEFCDGKKKIGELEAELAASQAREQQLREALEAIREVNIRFGMSVVAFDYALALPHDDTALKQYGAKLLRDVGKKHEKILNSQVLYDLADELEQTK